MKKYILLLLIPFCISACNSKNTNSNSTSSGEESTEKGISTDKANDDSELSKISDSKICDVFLNEFGAWSDDFIEAAGKMMEDPTSVENRTAYIKVAKDMAKWNSEWERLQNCADKPEHKKRFEEVTAHIQEEMSKLQE